MKLLILLIILAITQLITVHLLHHDSMTQLSELKSRIELLNAKDCPDYNLTLQRLPDGDFDLIKEK